MKRTDVKSRCPVNFSLEILGDQWSFIILRDIALYGKKTFSEFLASEERIGRSVLAARIDHLIEKDVIAKHGSTDDKRSANYYLTDVGIMALPILYEFLVWGTNVSQYPEAQAMWTRLQNIDRRAIITAWEQSLRMGSSFTTGPHNALAILCA